MKPKYKKISKDLYYALQAVLPYCVFDNFSGMYAQEQAIRAMKTFESRSIVEAYKNEGEQQ